MLAVLRCNVFNVLCYILIIGIASTGPGWNSRELTRITNPSRVSTDVLATRYIWMNCFNSRIFPSCLQVGDEKKTTKCPVNSADLLSGGQRPLADLWQELLLSGRKTSAALRTVEVRRDSSNCQCSAQPHVRLLRSVCLCVRSLSRTCDHPLSPLIITNRVSQAPASKSVGHRAGIKQQNNGALPLLNLLMGSQWLPWLPKNYQPLDSLTSLLPPGRVCVYVSVGGLSGAAAEAVVCVVCVRPEARPQLKRQQGPTVLWWAVCFYAGGEQACPVFSLPPTHWLHARRWATCASWRKHVFFFLPRGFGSCRPL